MRVIVTKTIDHGEKVYNLVFSNSCKKEWVYRVSENINIEDLRVFKKYVSYDIEIPKDALYWTPKYGDSQSNILNRRVVLPLTLQKKINMKTIDVKVDGCDIPVTTKEYNKENKRYILDYIESKIFQIIQDNYPENTVTKEEVVNSLNKLSSDNDLDKLTEKELRNMSQEYLKIQNNSKIPNELSEYIEKYLNCKYLLNDRYIFSVILPLGYKPGMRIIIKVYYEIPQSSDTVKPLKGLTYNECSPLPLDEFSRHILYKTIDGLRITNFQIHSSNNKNCTPITVLNNSLYFKDSNYIDAMHDVYHKYTKDDWLFYSVIPVRQGIRRWSFWVSILISFSLLISSVVRLGEMPDSFYTKTAPAASTIVAISALLISWFSRTEEEPIKALIQEKLKWILVLQSFVLYSSAALLLMTPRSFVWNWGWLVIYLISSLTNLYSMLINLQCIYLEGDKEISYKSNIIVISVMFLATVANILLILLGICLALR